MKALDRFYNFYAQRNFRERLLLIPLCVVFWYTVYYLIAISPINYLIEDRTKKLEKLNNRINILNNQSQLLTNMINSNLYKEWVLEKKTFDEFKARYKEYISSYSADNNEKLLMILTSKKGLVSISELKNNEPKLFEGPKTSINLKTLHQKNHVVTLNANYVQFYQYMKLLEAELKNVQWNRLSYEVTDYPLAKIELEFSTFYEKI